MSSEFLTQPSAWSSIDTWISVTGALAAMACALPGTWLLLRRQSLLGDALSHAVLPGIVIAYLGMSWMEDVGWLAAPVADAGLGRVAEGMSLVARRQIVLFVGAALSGVIAALLSEFIQRWGRVERSAALGVVFTSMFALGLLLIRLFADRAHLDPGCVLYGNLETTGFDTLAGTEIPRAAIVNGVMVLINGLLITVFYKELKLNTFDPELGAAQGLRPNWVSLVLMSITAATVVAAFESVGAILVIAMLIVPGATARLCSDRLGTMLVLSLVIAAAGAVMGHVFALTLPEMICSRIGFPQVKDASTAGMMAVTSFGGFLLAALVSPRHGIIRSWMDRARLSLRIAREDLLGKLYRRDETAATGTLAQTYSNGNGVGWFAWFARNSLIRQQLIQTGSQGDILTESGAAAARTLVRSHRLWELYMARHFELPDDHLHATAEQVEHFLGPELQAELAAELDQPTTDPHGKTIPVDN
ncbi:MAG: metal ABC transporter permease [Planctomycetes bacterium]|nr:metal ABC transporter permease [Planctomycetota bacterium]